MSVLINEMYGKFTQIPNIMITDTSIKHSAFRQYCYLMGKPSGWIVRNKDISNMIGISQDTIAKNFKILINMGWIKRTPIKNEKGKFSGGFNYHLFVVPTESGKSLDLGLSESDILNCLNNTHVSYEEKIEKLTSFLLHKQYKNDKRKDREEEHSSQEQEEIDFSMK